DMNERPAAVAIPEPLDDAPGQNSLPHGLSGVGISGWYQATANSVRFSFPRLTAPAAARRSTTVALSCGFQSRSTRLAQVVATPLVQHRSFTATGIPCSGPRQRPEAISSSARAAVASADSRITVRYACSLGLSLSIRSSSVLVSSTDESRRARSLGA